MVARRACASGLRPTPKARRSMPSRRFSRARSKSRTRARSLPRCWPAPSPASRWSISAPAPAARRWRSPRPWKTTARSTRPTSTSGGSRRSTSASRAPARAISRCARPRGVRRYVLADLAGRADLVLIDAPCTGTGTWRRNPDAKWRIRPGALAERIKQQEAVLERAAALVKPGGRIAYITCSVLAEENGDQVRAFAGRHPDFSVEKPGQCAQRAGRARLSFRPRGAYLRRRLADDAAPDRHRRVFRQPVAALCMTGCK